MQPMAICIAHRHEHVSNALPLPVSRRWSVLVRSFSQASAKHCETTCTGWCVTQYALAFARYSF